MVEETSELLHRKWSGHQTIQPEEILSHRWVGSETGSQLSKVGSWTMKNTMQKSRGQSRKEWVHPSSPQEGKQLWANPEQCSLNVHLRSWCKSCPTWPELKKGSGTGKRALTSTHPWTWRCNLPSAISVTQLKCESNSIMGRGSAPLWVIFGRILPKLGIPCWTSYQELYTLCATQLMRHDLVYMHLVTSNDSSLSN